MNKCYRIQELATLAGVSVRTLRFYDEIGLLSPAYCGENGYRYYEREQLLLLQQILFYRELGFELSAIKQIVTARDFDKVEALKKHRQHLLRESARFKKLIRTLDKTLSHLEEKTNMSDKKLYEGFLNPEKQEAYEKELIDRHGDPAKKNILESKTRTAHWKRANYSDVASTFDRLHRAFTSALERGLRADAAEVQALVREHYEVVNRFWTPDREAYAGLATLYREHADFRKLYASYHEGLAEYLAEAMRLYAEKMLAGPKGNPVA